MSFSLEDILNIMEEYDIDLLQLREAILAYRKTKSIDSKNKCDIPSTDVEDLFNWSQIRALEDPSNIH